MTGTKSSSALCMDDDRKNLELLPALLLPEDYELKFAASAGAGS